MRDFKTIQGILGNNFQDIKKIYLLGSTGAGKTSLVQNIIGTTQYSFPTTSFRRTTVATTEYVIKKDLEYKTKIILKKKEDVIASIQELVEEAIKKTLENDKKVDDVVFELEQAPDERFKLKFIVSDSVIKSKAEYILNEITPKILGLDINDEMLFSVPDVKNEIELIIQDFLSEIENSFNQKNSNGYKLFSDELLLIDGIDDKEEFIKRNKELLANEPGSISALVEYVRIEGDLLAEWYNESFDFILIDGEGIGHSFGEKKDTLSTRHLDYFNFCNTILLVENAENPFATGGQGAIETIFLNGYKNKFNLIFTKIDKLSVSDSGSYFRRNLSNLKKALEEDKIKFDFDNKDAYKLQNLCDKAINDGTQKEIKKLLNNIKITTECDFVPLEYDFDLFFSDLNRDEFIEWFFKNISTEHWAVLKAFARRMFNGDLEYKHIKPIAWIHNFIMRDINEFLRRNDQLNSEITYSQNIIKQKFSKKALEFIIDSFVEDKTHLWQQAYLKSGKGSHMERCQFINDQILTPFLPSKDNLEEFDVFRKDMISLLIKSGVEDLKSAKKIRIRKVEIKKVYGKKSFNWTLDESTNVLIGKNGSGKSTIIRLIDACLNNKEEVLKHYGYPIVEVTISKIYENGNEKEFKITNSHSSSDITCVLISTFDALYTQPEIGGTFLDVSLTALIDKFGHFQRSLGKIIAKKTESERIQYNSILDNIADADSDKLRRFQELSVSIDNITNKIYAPIVKFKEILDSYFKETSKRIVVEDERESLLIVHKDEEKDINIKINQLSSGEKQLLILFLTVILQGEKPFILLLDEPETSLHVEWQSTFLDDINKLNPNIQIIVGTHNPLITLNRAQDEVGVLKFDTEEVQIINQGTKHLDVSTVLLDHFGLTSLIGKDLQEEIREFTSLKLKEPKLSLDEQKRLNELNDLLANSFVGDIIYDARYFKFLKYIKENKGVNFGEDESISSEEMESFRDEFGGLFND